MLGWRRRTLIATKDVAERNEVGPQSTDAADGTQRIRSATDAGGWRVEQADAVDGSPALICYDGSERARNAITAAAALLVGRAAVILDVGPLALVAETYAAAGSGAADLASRVQADALAVAEEGAHLAREAGFRAEVRARLDTPTWRGVVGVADEIGAAVIVLGSRGLTGVRELVEGSLSYEVAEHARRPVLVVPPNEPSLS